MLLFLIAQSGYLAYQIMSPFFTAIAWAVVFSIVFYFDIFRHIEDKQDEALQSVGRN
jgi:hypothetical protein